MPTFTTATSHRSSMPIIDSPHLQPPDAHHKKDSTLQWHGKTYEVVGRYLAGRTVTVISSLLDPSRLRLEHLGKPIEVFPVDVHQNAHRRRGLRTTSTPDPKEPPIRCGPSSDPGER